MTRDKFEAWRQQQGIQRARVPERRQNLQDRLSDVDRDQWQQRRDEIRNDRQEFREGRQEDWQQYREGAREDWQNWYDDNYYYHYGWYHGGWHDPWHNYWDHMWDEHPAAVAFGLTCWGINTMSYVFGTTGYSNPYYAGPENGTATDYSQPQITVEQTVTDGAGTEPPVVPDEGLQAFEQARAAFYDGNYAEALRFTDEALKSMPNDAVVHEFRALTCFAQQKYMEAATILHSVLAVGPGWDWTTLSQLYPGIEVYTEQLRALEAWTKERPALPDGHFVLAYHYMTCGHPDDAAEQFRIVVKALSEDPVSARLLNLMTGETPSAAGSTTVDPASAVADVPAIEAEALSGKWKAESNGSNGSSFILELQDDGRFTWTYSANATSQSVAGVFAIEDSTLAMEPDSGGVMLADLRLDGDRLIFHQVGADPTAAPLQFSRQ